MKKTLALAFVLGAVAACSSDPSDDADQDVNANPPGTDTSSPQLTNGKTAPSASGCMLGATQKCCATGTQTQTCVKLGTGELAATGWGPCDACTSPPPEPAPPTCPDGGVPASDGSCPRKMNLNVDGDCVCAPACPADAPYIVGCKIDFQGSNANGCVAPAKNGRIYFQEGVKCDEGHLSGYVLCSSSPGAALDQTNCPINKSDPHFGSKPSNCPSIESGTPDSCYF